MNLKQLESRLARLEHVRIRSLLKLAACTESDSQESDLRVDYGGRTWRQSAGEPWDEFCERARDGISAATGRPVIVIGPIDWGV